MDNLYRSALRKAFARCEWDRAAHLASELGENETAAFARRMSRTVLAGNRQAGWHIKSAPGKHATCGKTVPMTWDILTPWPGEDPHTGATCPECLAGIQYRLRSWYWGRKHRTTIRRRLGV